jgi:hypothetical protein
LVFDHPTPAILASWLRSAIGEEGTAPAATSPLLAELDRFETALSTATPDDLTRMRVAVRLQMIVSKWNGFGEPAAEPAEISQLESASDDEIISFINSELGR